MASGPNEKFTLRTQSMNSAQADAAHMDVGLRQYMLRVYNYMASALALTGIVAFGFASALTQSEELVNMVYGSPLKWVIMLAPLGMVLLLSAKVNSMKASTAQAMFWIFASLMGLSLSSILLIYTGESVARVFFITAATFTTMSLYGYTTKRDLTGMGSFMMMGLFGIIIASVVNIFMQSSAMQFVISFIGVIVFIGLTAYDTQKIKSMYDAVDGSEVAGKKAIMGALTLYLDFINLFVMLMHLLGNRE